MSESNSTGGYISQRGDPSEGAIVIIRIVFLFVALFGVIGMFVLMTSRKYRGTTYAVYFLCMAVVDIGCLMTKNLANIDDGVARMTGSSRHFFLPIEECLLTSDIGGALSICSSWLLVAATTDRFISHRYPQFCASWCTKRRAIIICIITFVVSLTLSMIAVVINITNVVAMYENYESNGNSCELDLVDPYKWYNQFLSIFVTILIPLPMMLVMSVKIVSDLIKRSRMDNMASPLTVTSQSHDDHIRYSSYTLIAMCVVSLVTLLPECLAEMVEAIKIHTEADFEGFHGTEDTMWRSFDLFSNINYACKFYILMAASRMYRCDFVRLCRCRKLVDNGDNDLNGLDNELQTL